MLLYDKILFELDLQSHSFVFYSENDDGAANWYQDCTWGKNDECCEHYNVIKHSETKDMLLNDMMLLELSLQCDSFLFSSTNDHGANIEHDKRQRYVTCQNSIMCHPW